MPHGWHNTAREQACTCTGSSRNNLCDLEHIEYFWITFNPSLACLFRPHVGTRVQGSSSANHACLFQGGALHHSQRSAPSSIMSQMRMLQQTGTSALMDRSLGRL